MMTSVRLQTQLTHICRGSACTSQLLEFCSLNNKLQHTTWGCQALVYLSAFSSVHSRLSSAVALRGSSRRFHCPAVFAASHNSKRIVGLRIGLLGLYKAAALIATEVFAGEIWILRRCWVSSVAKVVRQHRWDCRAG